MRPTEFIRARMEEDKTWALAAQGSGDGQWESWNRSWERSPTRDLAADGVRIAALPHAIDEHVCRHDPVRVLAEYEAKRQIIEFHESWPVLVEMPSDLVSEVNDDLLSMSFSISKQIVWLTEREYRNRFGVEPPASPMIRALAAVYAEHPDYLSIQW